MGVTFIVAMVLLGVFALLQVLIVGVRFYPQLRAQIIESREQKDGEEERVSAAADATPAVQSAPNPAPAPDAATLAQAMQAVAESDRNFRVGDFEAALRQLQKAEALLPQDPMIQFRLGRTYDALDDRAAAYLAFQRTLAAGGVPPEIRREAEQKLALIAQVLPEGSASPSHRPIPTISPDSGAAVRDETGLQPGAMLGIVNASLRDGQPGAKNLRVAIKARPGPQRIDVSKMNVLVYFYEIGPDGEISLTESQPTTQWVSLPVDWAEGEPEILDVEYMLPEARAAADPSAANLRFHGYLVAVYYAGELQDSRADPGRLSTIADLPLYLQQEGAP